MTEWVWKEKIAQAIQDRTFDLSTDSGEWPTVHYLIAKHILRNYSDYEVHLRLELFANKISKNFHNSVNYLLDEGVSVYVIKLEGERNITAVTTDPAYRDAEAREVSRVIRNMQKHIAANVRHMELVNPELGAKIKRRAASMVLFLEDQKSLPFDDDEEAEA
jgi:hypothetical protein